MADIVVRREGPADYAAVDRALQRKGLGKKLIDFSLDKAAELGFGAVCFDGNIDFYGKSGFDVASKKGVRYHGLPEGADASFFQEPGRRIDSEARLLF